MIQLKNICKYFDIGTNRVAALDDISLTLDRGEILGVIGHSGAGKSTLIRCINLLETPSSGDIIVDGQSLMALRPAELRIARRKMGMIFQHFNLLSSRTVYQNIALPLELAGYSKNEIKEAVHPLLELTGLKQKVDAYPAQLSGGQKQRVAIARALSCRPHILLSDEATSALDPETTKSILDLLKSIRDNLNLTILLITHEMSVIKACCDRVGILQHGRLIEENEVGEFFAHPKTEVAKNFIISSLPQKLPDVIAKHVLAQETENTHPLWRLWFFAEAATQPVVAKLVNQFNLKINILLANVEYIKKHAMGIMILALSGEKQNLIAASKHLKELGIHLEVLGYVPNDIISFA